MGTSHHQCHREDTGSGNWGEVENKVDDNKKRCWGLGGCCLLNSGMKKTDQEIIVSRKHKSGLEIGVKLKTRLMTTKNVHGDV